MDYNRVILLIALSSFGKEGAFGRELYERYVALHVGRAESYPGAGEASGWKRWLYALEKAGAPIRWDGWKYRIVDGTITEGDLRC